MQQKGTTRGYDWKSMIWAAMNDHGVNAGLCMFSYKNYCNLQLWYIDDSLYLPLPLAYVIHLGSPVVYCDW